MLAIVPLGFQIPVKCTTIWHVKLLIDALVLGVGRERVWRPFSWDRLADLYDSNVRKRLVYCCRSITGGLISMLFYSKCCRTFPLKSAKCWKSCANSEKSGGEICRGVTSVSFGCASKRLTLFFVAHWTMINHVMLHSKANVFYISTQSIYDLVKQTSRESVTVHHFYAKNCNVSVGMLWLQ